jgi:hypothetical protein
MPVELRFTTPVDVLACRWAISPLRETTSAVRLLAAPHRQGYHQAWLRSVAPALAELDLTPLLQVLAPAYNPDFLMPPPAGPNPRFADELALVRKAPPRQVAAQLRRTLRPSPTTQALLAHPQRARDLLADTLEACWERLIEPWWPRLRDVLAGDIAHRTHTLAAGGLAAVLADLHPKVRWRNQTLFVDVAAEAVREVDETGLVLMPSTFEWPHVGVMFDKPWSPTIDYPARGIAALWESTSDPSVALARLVGHTRATLLAALTEPTSTTGLARRCALPNSTVSEQVAILREAGLVTTHRAGRYLRHTRTPLGTQLLGTTR